MHNRVCIVDGCGKRSPYSSGYCDKHEWRYRNNGSPHALVRTENGLPHKAAGGYMHQTVNGKRKLEHVHKAEAALGRELRGTEEVHHVDYNRANNGNTNLVIVPNKSYHRLIHQRTNALNACGHANWRKCKHCKVYSPPDQISVDRNGQAYHKACATQYQRDRAA